ncbi:MAG: tetratricopeptide repeat protein [Rhodospirillales bacterium]|nr:tetratricopeptide repeat protein [Rhodospirillales bacterium]
MPEVTGDIDQRIDQALEHQRTGSLDDAEAIYQDILTTHPDHAETRHFLGLVLHQRGAHNDAVRELETAVGLAPGIGQFRFNLGLVQSAAGDFKDAAKTFKSLIDTGIDAPDLTNAYAVALRGAGELTAAEKVLTQLTAVHPAFAGGFFNLGNLMLADGRLSEAVTNFERALALSPDTAEIIRNLAAALQGLGELARAEALLDQILKSAPDDVAALNNIANIYRQNGELDAAEDALNRALTHDPNLPDAAYTLGTIRITRNDIVGGREALSAAINRRPGFTKAAWASSLALPQIYGSADERRKVRKDWLRSLNKITEADIPDNSASLSAAVDAISEILPFALAYQGEDDLEPMTAWGAHVSKIAGQAFPALAAPPSPPGRERKRIGFVSAHFRAHTICNLFRGWVEGINRDEFEVHLISTTGQGDDMTKGLAARTDRAHISPMGLRERAHQIHELECDALIYPDIGMDPRTQVLAALPLAPRQMMSWGHPVTSGLPTIDTFISSALMEPEGGARFYRENLVTLPGLSVVYDPPPRPNETAPHDYLCAQSLFKILPEQDESFAAILKQTPGRKLAFFSHPVKQVTAAFRARIASVLSGHGIDPDGTLDFIPPCNRKTFLKHMAGARVILDTFGWSGGNTSLEALAMGAPIVTLPGRFMRGRHTYAMHKMMELETLIANDANDYIDIAVQLMTDDPLYENVRERIAAHSDRLFTDPRVIPAFNDLLRSL